MLSHISQTLPYILYRNTNLALNNERSANYILITAYTVRNLPAFLHLYNIITRSIKRQHIQWTYVHDYLIEAVELYPPNENLANNIAFMYVGNYCNSNGKSMISKLADKLNKTIIDLLMDKGYCHMFPHILVNDARNKLYAAIDNCHELEFNYLIPLAGNLKLLRLSAIINRGATREFLKVFVPHLDKLKPLNKFVLSAYIHNKLPDEIPASFENHILVKLIVSHYTGTIDLESSTYHGIAFVIADKLGVSDQLFIECVRVMKNRINNYHHYYSKRILVRIDNAYKHL